ncbi:MAG: HEAT repeat domain-containing protein [Gemmatimonadales bacterium]
MIVRMSLGVALAGSFAVGGGWRSAAHPSAEPIVVMQDSAVPQDPRPPAAWLQGDPADSLYRAAREALDRRDYRSAADLFAQVPSRFPRSGYAADAYYWRAFSLYRLGGTAQLKTALQALDTQRDRFPKAATTGDAKALARRIQGELARQGDPEAAARVAEEAEDAARQPEPPVPPMPPMPPTGSVPPTPPSPPSPPGVRDRDDRCADDDDDTKLAALNALMQMDDARARPILRRVLARRDAGSVCLRRKAVFLIAQEDADGTEDILLETARNDPDPEVREQAVFWLSQVGTERAVGALDSILRTSKDPALQEKAVFALSQHDSPRAIQALRTYAERPDLSENLREKAIFWIGQSGGKENEAFLRSLYGRLKETELRNKVLFSISQTGGTENMRWLLGVARDKTQPMELRKQALFWAGQGDVPIADLASLYTSITDREMREQVIFVYSQRDDSAAADRLLEIARRDPDTELRKKALFWLGQSSDPRAAKALQEIIEQP